MQLKLTDLEVEILRKLVNGEAVSISSQHRYRLELAGMLREGPGGIEVTLTGRGLARQKEATQTSSEPLPEAKIPRDRRGRRMPFQRRSVF
jgi:hypothetical protein